VYQVKPTDQEIQIELALVDLVEIIIGNLTGEPANSSDGLLTTTKTPVERDSFRAGLLCANQPSSNSEDQ
jgi:hypothetical protein